jgi:RNA polymerase sigma-70 factor (ECF subfamily)
MSGTTAERLEALLAEHGEALWRLAGGYAANRADREDLYQDIVLAVWQALPRFRGESSERTFVFRVAHNRGLTHRQRRRRIGWEPLDDDSSLPATTPTPLARAVEADARRRLHGALRVLPAGHRQVVMLSLEDLSQREIGEVLGISEGNVAVRLHRARKRLAALLEKEEER